MRAVRYHSHGGPEVLRIEEVPVPVAAEGQVLVEVEAVGANAVDAVFRSGTSPWPRSLPATLTGDVVGRVVEVGAGVAGVAVGDRVAALAEDAFADVVAVDARWLAPVPAGADAGEATALSMTAPLALRVLLAGRVADGDTVLIQSAAGGVGHLAVQLAAALGAGTIIGTASSPDKREFVRACGAHEVVDSADPGWAEQVRAIVPGGVDVVLDAVGGEVFERGLELLAPLGRLVSYGAIGGALPTVAAASLFALKQVTGMSVRAWQAARPDLARADMREVAQRWAKGELRPVVHARFPLTEVAAAHAVLDARQNLGRVVVTM